MIDQFNERKLPYDHWLASSVREVVELLAGGAEIDAETGDVLTRHGCAAGPILTHLNHHGWTVNTPSHGAIRLSDDGLKSYLRSTDELGDGKLIDPHGFRP